MLSPPFESFLALCEELMPLVYCGHSRNCTRLVVQDLVGYMRCNSDRGHARNTRPSQIVDVPVGYTANFIQLTFCRTESLKRTITSLGEHEFTPLARPLQHRYGLIG